MNTAETEFMVQATGIPVEINYLKTLINYRLNNPDGQQVPQIPDVETWNLPIKKFIKEHHLDNDQNVCSLLLIGLAPHVVPGLFDVAIQEKIKHVRRFSVKSAAYVEKISGAFCPQAKQPFIF